MSTRAAVLGLVALRTCLQCDGLAAAPPGAQRCEGFVAPPPAARRPPLARPTSSTALGSEPFECELDECMVEAAEVAGTIEALRAMYGTSPTFWGDLDASQTRSLYHELLPRALERHEKHLGFADGAGPPQADAAASSKDIEARARLASAARRAAKLYVRERSILPARIAAHVYDAVRCKMQLGRFAWSGMTVDDVWTKYEQQILRECYAEEADLGADDALESDLDDDEYRMLRLGIDEAEVARRVGERILQRACRTNAHLDDVLGVPKRVRLRHAWQDLLAAGAPGDGATKPPAKKRAEGPAGREEG
jgi:hypothetical protein